jgi:hypothetical protein
VRSAIELARARAAHRATVRAVRRPRPDEGFAMSSPIALMSAAAVVLAGVGFFVTDRDVAEPKQVVLAATAPAPVEQPVTLRALRVKPTVKRSEVYVSVYNNSNITGLAGSTAARIGSAGWQVVGSDNWYGTIPATTIYYPERLRPAAKLLSKDLGVERVLPAVDPMLMDRLTVILTADFG